MPRHAAYFRLKLRGETWQAYFTRHGHEHQLSTGCTDKERAREEAARLVLEHDTQRTCHVCGGGGAAAPDSTSTEKLAEQFLKTMKHKGAQWGKRAATDLNEYVIDRWKHPRDLTSRSWEEEKLALHSTPTRRRSRLTWRSIANLANTVRAFLRYCLEVGVIESVPEIRSPTDKQLAADAAYTRPLTEDEQWAFLWALAVMGEARALRIYVTLFQTWMRKGALASLTRRWVNFERETILIPSRYTKAQKGDLEIDLTPMAAEAIREEMRERWGETVPLDQPIFGGYDYRLLFPKACELAGIDLAGLTAHHVTRRTAATLAGEKPGASLASIKAQGGWRSSAVVDRYMKASLAAARKVTR